MKFEEIHGYYGNHVTAATDYRLKDNVLLLDGRDIPTRRRAGILFNIVKSNHYKFPKNPYYRCMIEWNNLTVEISLLPDKESFSRANL